MVKTRSSDRQQKKEINKGNLIQKIKQHSQSKELKNQIRQEVKPRRLKHEQIPTYKATMVPFEQEDFHPQKYLISMQSNTEPPNADDNCGFDIIEIVEHQSIPDDEQHKYEQLANSMCSHASTEKKMDNLSMRQRMNDLDPQLQSTLEKNIMPPKIFYNYCQTNLDISSCGSIDIAVEGEIQAKLQLYNVRQEIQEDKKQLQPNQQQEIIEIIPQIPPEPILEHNEGNAIVFGPPNIDDLSTNESLNQQQVQQIEQVNEVRHIFIENEQNILDNLSQISTKPCMSHIGNEPIDYQLNNGLTPDEYNEMLWQLSNEAQPPARPEELLPRLHHYLDIMIQFITKQDERDLTRAERSEFWSIMNLLHLNLRDQACIGMMINFAQGYDQCLIDDRKNRLVMEYELIKGRLQSLSMICSWNYHEDENARINLMLNRYLMHRNE